MFCSRSCRSWISLAIKSAAPFRRRLTASNQAWSTLHSATTNFQALWTLRWSLSSSRLATTAVCSMEIRGSAQFRRSFPRSVAAGARSVIWKPTEIRVLSASPTLHVAGVLTAPTVSKALQAVQTATPASVGTLGTALAVRAGKCAGKPSIKLAGTLLLRSQDHSS